jgi:hypothetical protein
METAAGNGGLVNDNSVQQWHRGVGVWPGEHESTIMAEQPGVEGLHTAEVRNLDEFRMPRLRMHKATPQDQDTTVPAEPETIALLHYPGRRCQTEGGPCSWVGLPQGIKTASLRSPPRGDSLAELVDGAGDLFESFPRQRLPPARP